MRNTYSQYALHGGVWKPGKITRSSSNSASSPAFSTEQTFTYDSHGLPLTVTHNSHSALALTTTYTYDEVGNVLTSTQTGLGVNPVTSYNEYDATHRFVTRSYTSPASAENLFTYDVWGNTLTETDVTDASSPLTVTHTYDGWGLLTENSTTGSNSTYSYNRRTVTGTHNGQTFTQVFDAWGNVISSYDAQTVVDLSYHPSGKNSAAQVYRSGGQRMTYDDVGNLISHTDADAGTTTYEYNALGNITRQTDARGKITVNEYDALNRLVKTTIDGVDINYTYGTSGSSMGRLVSKSMDGKAINYAYDAYGRITDETRSLSPYRQYTFTNEYDQYGRQTSRTFPGNITVNYEYDGYGNRIGMHTSGGTSLWHLTAYNGLETEELLGDTLLRRQVLSSNGYLSELSLWKGNSLLRGLAHEYDTQTGSLTRREDMANGRREEYTYDALDRLTAYGTDGQNLLSIGYGNNDNIASKTGLGNYTYNNYWNQPHALQSVDNTDGLIEPSALTTEYNEFGKVTLIEDFHSMKRQEIAYGPDLTRWVSENYLGNSMTSDRTYLGDLEISTYGPGEAVLFYYLDNGVVLRTTGGSQATPYYLFTDHQGSVLNIYDGDGQEVFAATYDPWGRQTITKNDISFHRGYCGHEMLPDFGLINMNGRVYDPLLGRFLSPDPYVQDPLNPQCYNRYAYCMNNPVNYTDPSGYLFGIDDFALACIAAKFVFSSAMSYSSGQSLWKSVSTAAIQTGVDIAVAAGTAGIGNIMGHGVGTFGNELARAGLHGMLQGTGSALMGGDYLQGFTAGAFSSLVGSGAQVLGLGSSGILGSTTLAGGFGSYIAGGDFINGASIGISIGLHNHLGNKYRRIGRNTFEAIEPLEEVVCVPRRLLGLDAVHSMLDVIGMIPGGDFADFLNAGIYAIEGDYANAGISAAAMIPVVGNFATGGKLINGVAKYTKSNMKYGREMHKLYRAGEADGRLLVKECRNV
ncbi:MAG: hypothetical protein J5971_01725 [Prevotella sp.]|nr:hypothetical protein [Prevotella sp.]